MWEYSFIVQQQLPISSHDPFPKYPLVDEVIDLMQLSANPTLPLESDLNFVDIVKVMQSSLNPTLSLESEMNTTRVLFSSFNFSSQGGIPSMETPPNPKAISFN